MTTSTAIPERHLRVLGAAAGLGFPDPGCALAPDRVREASQAVWLAAGGGLSWEGMLRSRARANSVAALAAFDRRLARRVRTLADGADLLAVLGGDHAIAPGTWAGARGALGAAPGLIWIDAHLDAHTPATTRTGNLHGMPLACLLGHGPPQLTRLAGDATGAILDPAHVVVLGARAFDPQEAALLERLGARVIGIDAVRRQGLAAMLAEALAIAARSPAGFGISLDLDAVDPVAAPGVNTPVAGGIPAAGLVEALRGLRDDPRLKLVEIVEFNPLRDVDGRSLELVLDLLAALAPTAPARHPLQLEVRHGARNYAPQPVLLTRGRGVHVWDSNGRRYLDMMGAYSALAFGHGHPALLAALNRQAKRLALTSRAFHTDTLGAFLARACELTGMDRALPMNSGTEAVETALKAARKWAYRVKGVAADRAGIIVCDGNFHGRTIAIIGFSSEPQYRAGFGPFAPGFVRIPYGDVASLEAAITPDTAAFLVEPIQGEAGIVVPPAGYLARAAQVCRANNVLFIADEVQTGLGRTGALLACDHEAVKPDGLILGKALGGGLLPVSLFLARAEVMDGFDPATTAAPSAATRSPAPSGSRP